MHQHGIGEWQMQSHKCRSYCSAENCLNQAYARKLCVKHGGKRSCRFEGCQANARHAGYCCRHGPQVSKRRCQTEGCTKFAHARGLCVRHGGGRRPQYDPNEAMSASEINLDEMLMSLDAPSSLTDVVMSQDESCAVEFTAEEATALAYFLSPNPTVTGN
ncbi:hypothetical protein Ae201684P_010528 [Aphanomyces euteiches]|uniref:WRKY19-like zinc finger domain-containing protein n=1 Tax=Aphanomyces euteiches TaxID=100861 RepID=A0A6G0WP94_9STRA|nr:hypothetical protein Ae201684_013182 [Aphanomyces euteiches]KAH9076588.1 hypothetical protein Ae201684P_010528 [Aphanomyces euteiches]